MKAAAQRYGVLEIAVGLLMAGLVAVVFAQVVIRYVTYQPLAWTEEVARLVFIWACMLGAAVAARRGTHFAITLASGSIPGALGRAVRAALRIGEALFYGALTYSAFVVARVAHAQTSVSLEFPMSLPYLAIALGGALMCAYSVLQARRELNPARPGP